MNSTLKTVIVCLAVLGLTVGVVGAVITWSGTATWSIASPQFAVYDSAVEGNTIASPYTLTNPPTATGTYTYTYYIENTGNVLLNFQVAGSITGTGNTASWTSTSFSLPVSTTRQALTLTLTVAASGSYSWTFTAT